MKRIAQCAVLLLLANLASVARADEHNPGRVIQVFVALADNRYQGIVPVPAALGNGSDPARNLYWGAAFGVKAFFSHQKDWELVSAGPGPKRQILERCIFRRKDREVYLIADAYEGREIGMAVTDFLSAAAGMPAAPALARLKFGEQISLPTGGAADVVAYLGHDTFMDSPLPIVKGTPGRKPRWAIVLACASKQYFGPYLRQTGATPLLWTTGLMAPEAYTLEAALEGWISGEEPEAIRQRAARAYDAYQKCGIRRALRLFSAGW
jgi:hypothetical protein